MHTFLSLHWDEWGSIIAIITSVCYLANWILSKTVKAPLDSLRNEVKEFRKSETAKREELGDNLNVLNDRVSHAEGRITGHDHELRLLRTFVDNLDEAKDNKK